MNKSWAEFFDASFLAHVYLGHLPWELIREFPAQSATDRAIGDAMTREVVQFIDAHLDEGTLRTEGKLPPRFLDALRKTHYPKLLCAPELGGRGLSHLNAFRVLQAAFHRSIPAALAMSLSNSFGVASLIPALPDCPFRAYVLARVREGVLSGWADTEPTGAANRFPSTRAISHDGGKTFLINGEKCYIGNGSVADLLIVSVTVELDGKPEVALFAVETSAPGFTVRKNHDFMGIEGAPIAALSFRDVRVTREQMLEIPESHWRDTLLIEPLSALGRMFTVVAVTTAISKSSLACLREFQENRIIDGRKLKDYPKSEALVAKTVAEVFALESVVEWCLLGSDGANLPNRWWEQTATKNIASMAASRIADRAISMLGASGYERAESKRLLGLNLFPTEQNYRDVRGFRISGGVDFLIDYLAASRWMTAFFYNENFSPEATRERLRARDGGEITDSYLSEANVRTLNHLKQMTRGFGEIVRETAASGGAERLRDRQTLLIQLNRFANEVFTLSATLARSRRLIQERGPNYNLVAEEYAAESLLKLEMLLGKIRNERFPAASRRKTVAELT